MYSLKKTVNCRVTVIQKDEYKPGMHPHVHLGNPGATTVHKVRAKIKEKAALDHFKSAAAIAEKVLSEELNNEPVPNMPAIENLAAYANSHRKKMRPPEPKDLNFDFSGDYIPGSF